MSIILQNVHFVNRRPPRRGTTVSNCLRSVSWEAVDWRTLPVSSGTPHAARGATSASPVPPPPARGSLPPPPPRGSHAFPRILSCSPHPAITAARRHPSCVNTAFLKPFRQILCIFVSICSRFVHIARDFSLCFVKFIHKFLLTDRGSSAIIRVQNLPPSPHSRRISCRKDYIKPVFCKVLLTRVTKYVIIVQARDSVG